MLTHLSLFTGIGGIDLAAEWAGFETIAFVEIDPYCQKVLKKHWSDVPIIGDIRDVTRERIQEVMADTQGKYARQSEECHTRREREVTPENRFGLRSEFGGQREIATRESNRTIPPVTLITGGFPCQPVSQAGKRKGKDDDRWLWPEMLRVISEIRPSHVCAENVAGLTTMVEQHRLLGMEGKNVTRTEDSDIFSAIYTHEESMQLFSIDQDLTDAGYWTEYYLIPACAVNAPHRRDRIFIVAHSDRTGCRERWGAEPIRPTLDTLKCIGEDVADTENSNRRWADGEDNTGRWYPEVGGQSISVRGQAYWPTQSPVRRVFNGSTTGLDGGIDEVLRILWEKYGTAEMVKRSTRQHLGQTPILLNQVLRRLDTLTEEGQTKEWSEASPKTTSEKSLREMWAYYWFATTSQGQESSQQLNGESSGAVPNVPQGRPLTGFNVGDIWLQEPNIPRVASGIKDRVNRLRCLGNAVVPAQIYPILKAIAEIEGGHDGVSAIT